MQGVQVGVGQVGHELIDSVAGLVGQGEESVEHEVQVGVVAEYGAVKGVSCIGSCCHKVPVIIVHGAQMVNLKGVQLYGNLLTYRCAEAAVHGARAKGLSAAGKGTCIEFVRFYAASNANVCAALKQMAELQVHIQAAAVYAA